MFSFFCETEHGKVFVLEISICKKNIATSASADQLLFMTTPNRKAFRINFKNKFFYSKYFVTVRDAVGSGSSSKVSDY